MMQQITHCPGFEISCADYLQANLKPPPEKEDVKIETSWEGVHYYLPGELAGQERYGEVMNGSHWQLNTLTVLPYFSL